MEISAIQELHDAVREDDFVVNSVVTYSRQEMVM